MESLGIPQPDGEAVTDIEDGVRVAARIGYPVLVRPSYVLGGRAMQIVPNEEALRHYLKTAVEVNEDQPVLVDHYIIGKELEVDAVCDGENVFIPGIMELVERTGVHSRRLHQRLSHLLGEREGQGDHPRLHRAGWAWASASWAFTTSSSSWTAQENVYVIEVNPRSSRTVPFLSKATRRARWPTSPPACILGKSLRGAGHHRASTRRRRSAGTSRCPAFSLLQAARAWTPTCPRR